MNLCGARAPRRSYGSKSDSGSADDRSSTVDSPKDMSILDRKRDEIHIQKPRRCFDAHQVNQFTSYPQDPDAFSKKKKKVGTRKTQCALLLSDLLSARNRARDWVARQPGCVCVSLSLCVSVAAAVENEDRTRPEQSMYEDLI